MPKKRILFGIGVGALVSCAAVFFIYSSYLDEVNAEESLPLETEAPGGLDESLAEGSAAPSPSPAPEQLTPAPYVPSAEPSPAEPIPTSAIEPTSQPVPEPTLKPTLEPTLEPTLKPTPEPTLEPTLKPTPEPTLEPTPEPVPTPRATERPRASWQAQQDGSVLVYIPHGISAKEVTTILQNAGIVSSAEDFLNVLRAKGYTVKLSSGPFTLFPGTDYDALAEMIVLNRS